MASAADGEPSGPLQFGRSTKGQYVYWITMSQPTPEMVANLGLKRPEEFTREQFGELMVKAHGENDVDVIETVCFFETHANGDRHHNCLVRAKTQFRWLKIASHLRSVYKVCVNYGANIKTWAEGVTYGRVASEHKSAELLDHKYTQWAQGGNPADLDEYIPRHWKGANFVRKAKLTPMGFLGICRDHSVQTEDELWALAVDLESKGDKGLMAHLLEIDVPATLGKVKRVVNAKQAAERAKMSRMELLEQAFEKGRCACEAPGACYDLLKDVLNRNCLDGVFQQEVVATLRTGRKKLRNLCLLGGPGCAKSYLFKPLALIYNAYSRPDGGSYQLEEILDKEIVFLNDFEYDEDAKKWCPWGYFKRFLEGESLAVACPKNRGGNKTFTSTCPVFITAPQEISLYRAKRRDEYETKQMHHRVKYMYLSYEIPEALRKETDPCMHCGARLYLEGVSSSVQVREALPASSASSSSGVKRDHSQVSVECKTQLSVEARPKVSDCVVQRLKDVQSLKDSGIINTPESKSLKDKILADLTAS